MKIDVILTIIILLVCSFRYCTWYYPAVEVDVACKIFSFNTYLLTNDY